ncbi:VanZ family protein [Mongoliitalea daihaiensis]|uniref:VanZ family protein n=1 Tax=Mongoliitalea daihaiensis TaxID=2782006 RepID=UPI001F211683|nr:VanZ family protein [Mongoliitalea daihaiensis]UJP63317.1 VanZ family protein [Mongoliitalea daihaiensis]
MPDKERIKLYFAIGWLLLVILLLLTPGNTLPKGPSIPHLDKIAHIGLFGVLTFLWVQIGTLDERKKIIRRKLLTNLLVFTIIFPIFVEYVQAYVPNRSFEYEDIVANLIGGTIGFIGFIILYKVKPSLV